MIAISYRREDSTSITGRVYDRLQSEFGKPNVFMDFDSIPYGVDFREHITKTLDRAKVVVVMIGPDWMGQRSRKVRRIDDPTDFVRLEVACALQRKIPIIPVLVNNAKMPAADALPKDIAELAFRNGLVLDSGIDFHHHTDRLIAGIRSATGAGSSKKSRPQPRDDSVIRRRRVIWIALGGCALAAACVAAAVFLFHRPSQVSTASQSNPLQSSTAAVASAAPSTDLVRVRATLQINGDSHGQTFEFIDADGEHHSVKAPDKLTNLPAGYGQMIVVAGLQPESVWIKPRGVTSWTYSQSPPRPAAVASTKPSVLSRGKLFAGTWRGNCHNEVKDASGAMIKSWDAPVEVVIDETETRWGGLTGGSVLKRDRTLAYNGVLTGSGGSKQQLHATLIVNDDGVTATYTTSVKPAVGGAGQLFAKGTLQRVQ